MDRISMNVGRRSPNFPRDVKTVQQLLNRFRAPGRPLLKIDGLVGARTMQAIEEFQGTHVRMTHPDGIVEPDGRTMLMLHGNPHGHPLLSSQTNRPTLPMLPPRGMRIAWGARVSPAFKQKAIKICKDLDVPPDFLMAAMAFESAETFSPKVRNAAGSGAVGLIQFMPSTARALGASTEGLAAMTAEAQLDYVKRYFAPRKGQPHSIEDIHMAILYPAAIGASPDHVLFKKGTTPYAQNKGLDSNRDGRVTVQEAASRVRAKLEKGLRTGFIG